MYKELPVIDGSVTVGSTIARVVATDNDLPPFNRSLTGEDSAPVFFDVDFNGNIFVKSALSADTSTQYNLRLVVSDSGRPPKSSVVSATVQLTKNR